MGQQELQFSREQMVKMLQTWRCQVTEEELTFPEREGEPTKAKVTTVKRMGVELHRPDNGYGAFSKDAWLHNAFWKELSDRIAKFFLTSPAAL